MTQIKEKHIIQIQVDPDYPNELNWAVGIVKRNQGVDWQTSGNDSADETLEIIQTTLGEYGCDFDDDLLDGGMETSPAVVLLNEEVFCTTQIEGTHSWSACPYDEVGYLRDPHRHMFHIKAYKHVTHSNRDVEFIMLKHRIESYLLTNYGKPIKHHTGWEIADNKLICEFGEMSCEMIAKELIAQFDLSRCEVSEDGENGAEVTTL